MIICAALKIHNKEKDKDIVMPCYRHGDGYVVLYDLVGNKYGKSDIVEGFIKDTGEFMDRKDALDHARQCGQLSQADLWYKSDHGENELYSEDLY